MKKRHKDAPAPHPSLDVASLAQARELFWQNVMREMLTSLSMQRARLVSQLEAGQAERASTEGAEAPIPQGLESFDGRMAIVTNQGERIPIADVTPLFACSIGGTMRERALSEDVQCTIFQVRTPSGEVYTFPVHEIRGFHALTEEAMQSLQREASEASGDAALTGTPFGFAAFTSLARELEDAPSDGGEQEDSAPVDPPPPPSPGGPGHR
ncbi:MAG: hypothetical protein IPJ41_16615 [Phycisphaerales bacterium]|nr:hypothetical protein [Phycisphaerales bacterium]